MPALLWLFPEQPAGALAVVTLTVVFFNALSGTVLSLRRETVRLKTGLAYGAPSLPLVWAGSRLQAGFDRHVFDLAFEAFCWRARCSWCSNRHRQRAPAAERG